MGYCTEEDVELAAGGHDRLLELSDLRDEGAVNSAVVADAIAIADSWIDGFLRGVYHVPLAEAPRNIRALSAREAAYQLKVQRNVANDDDRAAHEERRNDLLDIKKNGGGLALANLPRSSTAQISKVVERGEEADVSRSSLKGFW